jgi:hypothetical protein
MELRQREHSTKMVIRDKKRPKCDYTTYHYTGWSIKIHIDVTFDRPISCDVV